MPGLLPDDGKGDEDVYTPGVNPDHGPVELGGACLTRCYMKDSRMIGSDSTATPNTRTASQGGVFRSVLDLFSSLWFGIFWAVVLFLYCSIGSGAPQVRKLPMLEMTEFEWFHWWPFNVMVICLTACMTLITIRRIPLRKINAGVWMIHTGIVILTLGSYYYFVTKVEGDAPVFRRQVRVMLPGMTEPASFVAIPGSTAEVIAGPDAWGFHVQSTNTAWPILSDEHAGESAYAVNVMVHPPGGEPFTRQLLDGYPQYTEDIIPGKGRAIKNIGQKLVSEALQLTLDYEPTTVFHVMDTWALFVRRLGETQWHERPIDGLPRYNDHVASRDHVFLEPNARLPLRALDLAVPAVEDADPLGKADVRITGYLRYAQMKRQWHEGGERLNPVLNISTVSDTGESQPHELIAFDPARSSAGSGSIEFVWLGSAAEIANLPAGSTARLQLHIPETGKTHDIALSDKTVVGNDGPFTPVEGTAYSFRIRGVQDGLSLPGARGVVSVALVDIKTPEGEFTRWVADQPKMTRDMHHGKDGSGDPHAASVKQTDDRLQFSYTPGGAPIILAGYPGGLHFVFNGQDQRLIDRTVRVGESVGVVPGLNIRIDGLWTHAVSDRKPYIVPPESRQRNTGEMFAMIRLEVDSGSGRQTTWLHFNQYALPSEQYVYQGRFAYSPEVFHLPDGTAVEVLFSRKQLPLPSPIALDDFVLDTHFGGYSGAVSTIRNYVSGLKFFEQGKWSDEPSNISVNSPTGHGEYWYFQSMWDKPPNNAPGSGMNYTGLGVGNRNGVYIQLFGCCLSVVGMLFAFYVKPILTRRRAMESQARRQRSNDETDERTTRSEVAAEVVG